MIPLFPNYRIHLVVILSRKTSFAILALMLFMQISFSAEAARSDVEMSRISGDIDNPRRHARLRFATKLSPEEASRIYEIISNALVKGFAQSGINIVSDYQNWKKYNTAPYISSTHGNHYLNNYANETAKNYGLFEKVGVMPKGSVIAKDSFAITNSDQILLGPLFIMQKMQKGFNRVTRDWKYIQVQPNGKLLGETNGKGASKVKYCIDCHSRNGSPGQLILYSIRV